MKLDMTAPVKISLSSKEADLSKANEDLAAANLRLQRENELLRIKAELVAENERLKREASMIEAQPFYPEEATGYFAADCGFGGWPVDPWTLAYGYGDMDLESTVAGSYRGRSFSCGTERDSLFSAEPVATPSEDASTGCDDEEDEIIEVLEDEEVLMPPPGLDLPETRTTIMMRNFPNSYQRSTLLELLGSQGFDGSYNLVYVPTDFSKTASFGYAFINFISTSEALRFQEHFHGFSRWNVESDKVCDVAWSDGNQGFQAHVDRYRNSPVMHETVPDEYKPAIYCDGVRIPFPAPTKPIKAPRFRKRE